MPFTPLDEKFRGKTWCYQSPIRYIDGKRDKEMYDMNFVLVKVPEDGVSLEFSCKHHPLWTKNLEEIYQAHEKQHAIFNRTLTSPREKLALLCCEANTPETECDFDDEDKPCSEDYPVLYHDSLHPVPAVPAPPTVVSSDSDGTPKRKIVRHMPPDRVSVLRTKSIIRDIKDQARRLIQARRHQWKAREELVMLHQDFKEKLSAWQDRWRDKPECKEILKLPDYGDLDTIIMEECPMNDVAQDCDMEQINGWDWPSSSVYDGSLSAFYDYVRDKNEWFKCMPKDVPNCVDDPEQEQEYYDALAQTFNEETTPERDAWYQHEKSMIHFAESDYKLPCACHPKIANDENVPAPGSPEF